MICSEDKDDMWLQLLMRKVNQIHFLDDENGVMCRSADAINIDQYYFADFIPKEAKHSSHDLVVNAMPPSITNDDNEVLTARIRFDEFYRD